MARHIQAALGGARGGWEECHIGGRFDAVKGGSIDTSDGRRAVSSSPGRGAWTAGDSGEMPGYAEEGIGIEMLLFFSFLFLTI